MVVFFMLRLTLAPCVESLIMIDRLLFLNEHGIRLLEFALCIFCFCLSRF